MDTSRRAVMPDVVPFGLLFLLSAGIFLSGFLACGIGFIFHLAVEPAGDCLRLQRSLRPSKFGAGTVTSGKERDCSIHFFAGGQPLQPGAAEVLSNPLGGRVRHAVDCHTVHQLGGTPSHPPR